MPSTPKAVLLVAGRAHGVVVALAEHHRVDLRSAGVGGDRRSVLVENVGFIVAGEFVEIRARVEDDTAENEQEDQRRHAVMAAVVGLRKQFGLVRGEQAVVRRARLLETGIVLVAHLCSPSFAGSTGRASGYS